MLKGKKILITGGTGSLGNALTSRLLESDVDTIRIYSRNESKQVEMERKFNDERLRFLIGDIRDKERLETALEDIDIVFHAAALKHVPVIEYNPFESIKTNVVGSQNVIDAAIKQDVDKTICISTDKAVSPLNTYGATKLLMEKLFVTANNFVNLERHQTKFLAVRYGNVFGSSGSIIPTFLQQIKNGQKITITDSMMTRFSVTMEQALDFILDCTNYGKPSEIYIPKLKGYSIEIIIEAFRSLFKNVEVEKIGVRPGEKFHEVLMSSDEARYSWDLGNKTMIANPSKSDNEILHLYSNKIKKNTDVQAYSSEYVEKLTADEIKKLIQEYDNS